MGESRNGMMGRELINCQLQVVEFDILLQSNDATTTSATEWMAVTTTTSCDDSRPSLLQVARILRVGVCGGAHTHAHGAPKNFPFAYFTLLTYT